MRIECVRSEGAMTSASFMDNHTRIKLSAEKAATVKMRSL